MGGEDSVLAQPEVTGGFDNGIRPWFDKQDLMGRLTHRDMSRRREKNQIGVDSSA